MNLAGLLNQSKLSLSDFWARSDARQRRMLVAAALAGILSLFYWLIVNPALSARAQLDKDIPVLRQQVAQIQLLSKALAALSDRPAVTLIAMSKANIEADLARNGLKAQSVVLTGDYAKVQLAAVSFGSTLSWLDEWQKSARVAVVDASIVALGQADMVNATFTLQQAKNE